MIRHHLDYKFIVKSFLNDVPYQQIVRREKSRLSAAGRDDLATQVTKSVVCGIRRDLKKGIIPISNSRQDSTYSFGLEEDNGGFAVFNGELDIERDKVLILNDIHFPLVSWDMLNRVDKVLNFIGRDDVTTILAGDVINNDAFSRWPKLVKSHSFKQEMKVAKEGLVNILEASKEVFYFRGNHEDRFLMHNNGELEFSDLAQQVIPLDYMHKVTISPYDRMWITSGGYRWLIAHQKETSSSNKIAVAEKLAWKYLCNVITTHQHKNAIARDKYNNFTLVSIGGLHDPEKAAYVGLKTSTGPAQEQGFGTLMKGKIKLWTPDPTVTNWDF